MAALIQNSTEPTFQGFGPSILAQQTRGRLQRIVLPADRMECRALLHDLCPLCPGVYAWLDTNQQICYVGKSKALRKRLLSYFAKNPAERKVERIRQTSRTLVWEPMSDELLALIREQELINRWRPEFNTQGQPVKRQPAFIVITGGMAPNASFTRRIPRNAQQVYGPVSGTGRLRAAVDSINQIFRLRDCPEKTGFEFSEKATVLRDHLANLKWLDRRMQALRHAKRTFNGVLPIAARKNRIAWLILKEGRLLGSAAEPTDQKRARAAAEYLEASRQKKGGLPDSIMDMNLQMILISWFRKHKQTAGLLVPFEEAIEVCNQRIAGQSASVVSSFRIAAEAKVEYEVRSRKVER